MDNNEFEVQKEPFSAKVKEFFRKKLVWLKRNPQSIALLFFLIPSLIYILGLSTVSLAIVGSTGMKIDGFLAVEWSGHAIFVNSLLSVLILALFLYCFPKHKKPNIVFIVLVFVFAVVMILMDVLFYVKLSSFDNGASRGIASVEKALTFSIVHIVFQGISMVMFALLPVYKKLLLKINTRKEIASNDIKEAIDIEDDE